MQQRCPAGIQIDNDTRPTVCMDGRGGNVGLDGRTMASWRQLREVVVRYGDGQCHMMERVVDRTDRAMLVFMGRIGDVDDDDHKGGSDGQADTASHSDDADDDDDDAGIDWEEGDEHDAAEAHGGAVERALSVMEATGALRGGQMNIFLEEGQEQGNGDQGVIIFKIIKDAGIGIVDRLLRLLMCHPKAHRWLMTIEK